MHDICATRQLKAQSGHIITPGYPLPYHRHLHCNVTIVVAPSQKLRLNIVTMELTPLGKTDCADWLYFNDKFHSLTVCGHRHNVWYDMNSNFLHVELESTSSTRSQGFWLYYEGRVGAGWGGVGWGWRRVVGWFVCGWVFVWVGGCHWFVCG